MYSGGDGEGNNLLKIILGSSPFNHLLNSKIIINVNGTIKINATKARHPSPGFESSGICLDCFLTLTQS